VGVKKKKKRTRGSGMNGGTHGDTGRVHAGAILSEHSRAAGPACLARLQECSYRKGLFVQAAYSVETDGSVTHGPICLSCEIAKKGN
jgi:hypothetical protein